MNKITLSALVLSFSLSASIVAADFVPGKFMNRMNAQKELMKHKRFGRTPVMNVQKAMQKEAGSLSVPVTKPATNVTLKSFQANWDAVSGADVYGVYSILTHTTMMDETYKLANEDFEKIQSGTVDNPAQADRIDVFLDDYTNICDWYLIVGVFAKGMVGINNSYAAMGAGGMLISPTFDLTNDEGKFSIDLTVVPSNITDISIGLYIGEDEEPIEAIDKELKSGSQKLHFEFTKGAANAYFAIIANGDGNLFVDDIVVSQKMKTGDYTMYKHAYQETDKTSCVFKTPGKSDDDGFGFTVNAYAIVGEDVIQSGFSDIRDVDYSSTSISNVTQNDVKIYVDDCLNIELSEPVSIQIYTPAGVCLNTVDAVRGNNCMELPGKGIYMVKVGDRIFKVVK